MPQEIGSYEKNVAKKVESLRCDNNNPCLKEQQMSYDCLSKNNYDRDKCKLYFQNYVNCQSFWNTVKTDRRLKGFYPLIPPLEEREKIKAEYKNKKI